MATGEMSIHISNKTPKTFTHANHATFNRTLLSHADNKSASWDMVIVSGVVVG